MTDNRFVHPFLHGVPVLIGDRIRHRTTLGGNWTEFMVAAIRGEALISPAGVVYAFDPERMTRVGPS